MNVFLAHPGHRGERAIKQPVVVVVTAAAAVVVLVLNTCYLLLF